MIDYNKCVDEFVIWWCAMERYASQYNSIGHAVWLPSKLPIDIITKLNMKLKKPFVFKQDDITHNIYTPHHWTVAKEYYHHLKISPELKLFCKLYNCEINVKEEPHKVIWGN